MLDPRPRGCGARGNPRRAAVVTALAFLLCALPATGQSRPAEDPSRLALAARLGPPPPEVDDLDRADLTRTVRRLIARRLDGEAYRPGYVPHSLQGIKCRASVTLRRDGRILGAADSDELPVVDAVIAAAEAALLRAGEKSRTVDGDLSTLGIEIELIGSRELVGHAGEPAERLSGWFEPALHGVAFRTPSREVLVKPSQLISMEIFCNDDGELDHRCDRYAIAMSSLKEKLGLKLTPPDHLPENVSVYRFRTTHWYQPDAQAEPTLLVAGLRPVSAEEAAPQSLSAVVADLGRFLAYRQNADGLFSYEYLPGRDMYWMLEQNWVRQAGTAWVMARYARISGDPRMADASDRCITALSALAQPLSDNPLGKYLHTTDSLHPLGAAALLSLALIDSPGAAGHEELLASLITAIEGMQQADGSFRTHFPPSLKTSSQDYYPGEALLAIARYYTLHPDGERRALCDRALPVYMQYFRATRVPAFVPWQAQAWGELARTTQIRKYADFVFEMTDFLLTLQLREDRYPLAIYDGGIDTTGEGRCGISSAVYLEGLVDAIRTADAFGETERAARYRAAARRMARFVLQLRFRVEEGFYVQSPRDVYGGLRNTPIDPTMRIDHAQHALAAFMGVVEVLTPTTRPTGTP